MIGKADVWREWSRSAVREIYERPLLELVYAAQQVHRKFLQADKVYL